MSEFIVAIDQGTTGTTVIVLDKELNVHGRVNQEFRQIYPQPGWVEHDAQEIWESTLDTLKLALIESGAKPQEIKAIGITNQRETTVVWDRKTGKPIHNAIVWQDRRTAERMNVLREAGHTQMVKEKTGLVLDPYFSGSKLEWILDHVEGAREKANKGELAFGTIDTFLLWRLTGGKSHKTDVSNASRTMLMDLKSGDWDDALLSMLNIPRSVLPEIAGNAEVFGRVEDIEGLLPGTPISGMAGDQQSALFGQACFAAGDAKCTYGTGAFLLMNTGSEIIYSDTGMLTTAAWKIGSTMTYALEGSAFIAGAAVQWLRDGLGLIESSPEVEALAASVKDSDGVVFVPALTGLGAPHWDPEARGVIWGLTRGSTKAHIARATLEGIAFQNAEILTAMQKDLGQKLGALKVDGGASANNLLMAFQADLLNCKIVRPAMLETTALGAALLAGLGAGLYTDLDDIRATWKAERTFQPDMDEATREGHLARWQEGLKRV